MICQSTQELIPQGMFASCGNQVNKTTKNSHAAIFEIKFGKMAKEVIAGPRERTAASLFSDLEAVASVVECSDSNTDDNFVPTRCIQDTKERQLVTRSRPQRLHTVVYAISTTNGQ